MRNEENLIHTTQGGYALSAAAFLFWLAWLLMPGVGVTDAREIFQLVGSQRSAVLLSVVLQLLSAVLYVPAVIDIVSDRKLCKVPGLRFWSGVLLVGAIGSAADAVEHMLAYAMTGRGLDTDSFVPLMAFMQGPGLWILAPMIVCFFAGGAGLAIVLARAGAVSSWNGWLHGVALLIGVLGAAVASAGILNSRVVGLAVLSAVSAAQIWTGLAVVFYRTSGLPLNLLINKKGEQL